MKKLFILPLFFLYSFSFSQMDCENFKTLTLSYGLPKSIAAGAEMFTEMGFTAQIGAAYTVPKKYRIIHANYEYDSLSNYADLFASIGWRVFRVDYVVSIFTNVGYTMGNAAKAQPFTSLKVLFPADNKAFSIEPVYIFGRGISGKLSIHLRI